MGTRRDFLKGFLASGAAATAGVVSAPTLAQGNPATAARGARPAL
jgi:FtsP/CotA-like multicopper oxidase with cupredoxin domain